MYKTATRLGQEARPECTRDRERPEREAEAGDKTSSYVEL